MGYVHGRQYLKFKLKDDWARLHWRNRYQQNARLRRSGALQRHQPPVIPGRARPCVGTYAQSELQLPLWAVRFQKDGH